MNIIPNEIIETIVNFNDFNSVINFSSTNKIFKNILTKKRKKILYKVLLQKAYQVGIHDGYIANSSLDINGYYLNDKPLLFEKAYHSWEILTNLSNKMLNM